MTTENAQVTAARVTTAPNPDVEDLDADDLAISHPLHAEAKPAEASPTFAELDVDPRIVSALTDAGIERTFAIQALTLPIALTGADLIGQARTGMGKTLGFGVPLLQRLAEDTSGSQGGLAPGRAPRALVMVPTRELCVQVTRDLRDAARNLRLSITSVYGGRAYDPQIAALQAGVDVIVGTPGRLLDLANAGHLVLGAVKVLVLDEADEMLDLGFLPDMERVLGMVPTVRQTMLFSATMPGPIITLARSFMVQPTHIRAELPAESMVHKTTRQVIYRAHALDKVEMLARILQARDRGLTMVFTRTKRTAAKVAEELTERGFAAAAVHGDLGQGAREQALRAFRSGKVDILVATDVAARGIDVEDVTHVVNYQCPEDEKTYIHRIGRTGRAGRSGVAISFIDWDDVPRWTLINDALDLRVPEPVETYSSSPHLYADLDIPEGTTGRLPLGARTRAGLAAEQIEDLGETGRGGHRAAGRDGRDGGRDGRRGRGGRDSRGGQDGDRGGRGGSGRGRTGRDGGSGRGSDGRQAGDTAGPSDAAPTPDGAAERVPSDGSSEGRSSDGRRRRRHRSRGGKPVAGTDAAAS